MGYSIWNPPPVEDLGIAFHRRRVIFKWIISLHGVRQDKILLVLYLNWLTVGKKLLLQYTFFKTLNGVFPFRRVVWVHKRHCGNEWVDIDLLFTTKEVLHPARFYSTMQQLDSSVFPRFLCPVRNREKKEKA